MERKGPDAITLTYDLLLWSIPVLNKFPRDQKFLLGDRIQSTLIDILEWLIEARYSSNEKIKLLRKANLAIEKQRFLVRLTKDLKYLNLKRYKFVSEKLDEIGRLVGGWIKSLEQR